MDKIVVVDKAEKHYKLGSTRVSALRGVSLDVRTGEFLVIAGPSGSGKSTLLNLIGCLDSPSAGSVAIDGIRGSTLSGRELDRLRNRKIGFVFQSFNLVPVLNVYENIELPLLLQKDVSIKERRRRVMSLIEAVGLQAQIKQKSNELSGGQRQRVAVARALCTEPAIVLADEPTANLDSGTGLEIIDLMHAMNRKSGTTFIFSSHDKKVIDRADRVIILTDGVLSDPGSGAHP